MQIASALHFANNKCFRSVAAVVSLTLALAPARAAEPAPAPRPAFTLDQLDAAAIPATERFPGLPKEAVAVLGSGRGRHAGSAYRAAISPDGTIVASGGADNLIRVWDARTLRSLAVLKSHTETPALLAFSPDGKWLASAAGTSITPKDREVRLWAVDGANTRLAAVGNSHEPEANIVHAMQFTPDSKSLFTVSQHGEVRSWDLTAVPPAERARFRIEPAEPAAERRWSVAWAAFAPDGRSLLAGVSSTANGKVRTAARIWNLAAGKPYSAPQWDSGVASHYFSPDGKYLVACAAPEDGARAAVWDLSEASPKEVAGLPAGHYPFAWPDPAGVVPAARFGEILGRQFPLAKAAGRRRYAGWADNALHLWDVIEGRAVSVGRLPLPTVGPRGSLGVGPQGFSADGTVLAGVTGNRVRVWDLTDRGPVERAADKEPVSGLSGVAFGPDGRSIIAGGDGLVRWSLPDRTARILTPPTMSGILTTDAVLHLFSGDGRRVARMIGDWALSAPVVVSDAETGRPLHILPRLVAGDPERPFYALTVSAGLSADGNVLAQSVAVSRGDGSRTTATVRVWDLRGATPKLTARLAAANEPFPMIAVSPDGNRVAVGTGIEVVVWDVGRAEPAVVARLGADKGVTVLAFAPDGNTLAGGRWDGDRVRVWELAPKPRERWSAGASGGVTALAFMPDGRLLGLSGGGLRAWDATGKSIATWPDLGVKTFTISRDGRHVATANGNGTVYILRLAGVPAEPNARQILDLTEKTYTECKTYRDRGSVVAVYTGPDGKKEGTDDKPRTFTTAFRRGGAFRFEFRNTNALPGEAARNGFTEIVWAKGDEVKTWPARDIPADTGKVPKVLFPLGVIAGVSEVVSITVPRLLLLEPKEGGGFLFKEKAERLADERVGTADCHRVRMEYELPNLEDGSKFLMTQTYWIDRRSYLIRRVRSEGTLPDKVRVVTTIDYDPAFDADLAPAELEFRPPKKP